MCLVELIACSLIGGIGISTVGPGGVLVSIALYAFAGMSPATVAGTAIVSHIATGVTGTIGYGRAGHFKRPQTRRLTTLLSNGAIVGAPLGIWINSQTSHAGFGIILGILSGLTGFMILRKQRTSDGEIPTSNDRFLSGKHTLFIGFIVAAVATLFGLGGPMLCVPLLALCGIPMLTALASAQAQSIIIAALGTVVYVNNSDVDWPMALLVMIPQIVGVMIGVRIAHVVPAKYLKYTLATALIGIAPYLAFG